MSTYASILAGSHEFIFNMYFLLGPGICGIKKKLQYVFGLPFLNQTCFSFLFFKEAVALFLLKPV